MEFMNTQIQYTFCLHILDMIHLYISGSFQFLFLKQYIRIGGDMAFTESFIQIRIHLFRY